MCRHVSLFPFACLFLLSLSLAASAIKIVADRAGEEPQTPDLPEPLQNLTAAQQNCLILVFTKSKLFENPKVQQALEEQACDSNGTQAHPEIWASNRKDNGWCEMNLDKVNSEFGPMVMHAQGALASEGARLYVQTTGHGIWIAIYQPDCSLSQSSDSDEDDDANRTLKRLRRWLLR